MKLIVMLCALVFIFSACEKKAPEEAKAADPVTLPVELSYKGATAIGDMNNVKVVLECNKRLSELNSNIGEFLADTVALHWSDGTELSAPRDSVVAILAGFVGSLTSMKIEYIAAVPVNNTTAGDEWVFSWTEETYTYKDGKVEEVELHEDYRLVGGKIREAFQYARKPPSPAK